MENLTEQQIAGLQRTMEQELARVLKEAREEMRPDVKANYGNIVDSVPDSGDEALAYTLIDTENAIIGQRLQQVRDINAALKRMQAGTYGICIDCEGEIDFERLSVYPTAKRCIECQRHHEKTYAQKPGPAV